jgi:demethylmenaquinone methyltransferase/2-methoxy-6-polyprenyl-1,4-benzoquinol methylase
VGSKVTLYEKAHFEAIRFVHDTLFGHFIKPREWLGQSGVTAGQNVLEVGCGSGFFTIPAAELVGQGGHLWALDNNPAAVDHVKRTILRRGIRNVDVVLADALHTGLPDGSFDVAFLYGVIHNLWDQAGTLLPEIQRVLKTGGILSISKSPRIAEERIIGGVTEAGLFRLVQKTDRVVNFERCGGAES